MSVPATRPKVEVEESEIQKYLKKKRLPKTAVNIAAARAVLQKQKEDEALAKGRDISIVRSDEPRKIIYGRARVGGLISFAAISDDNQLLNLIVTFAGCEVDEIESIYLDDSRVDFPVVPGWSSAIVTPEGSAILTGNVFLEKLYGSDSQTAASNLVARSLGWTSDHRQRGCAHVYIGLQWDKNLFADGLPTIAALIRGKKVYDPRTDTTTWSANAALCIADYMMNARYGLGVPLASFDNLSEAANICDELVETGSGYETRYQINGYIEGEQAHEEVLRNMAGAMGGNITYAQGKWRIWPAKWREPVLDLDESDLRSEIKIETMVSRRSLFNRVRGTYVNALDKYEVTDFPPVVNSTYLTEDGNEELWADLTLHYTTSAAAAQRLAKIQLEEVRQGIQVSATFGLRALAVQVPETVTLTLDRYGWDAKPFKVTDCELIETDENGGPVIVVALTLRETASGVYDWNLGEETTVDLAPNTNLPDPFTVTKPTGLTLESGTNQLYLRSDGTVFSRMKASWTPLVDGFVLSGGHLETQYKKSSESSWLSLTNIAPDLSYTYVLDVEDSVEYDFRIRAVNALGVASDWETVHNHQVVGKTAPPETVTHFNAVVTQYGISLGWASVGDIDLAYYEIRDGASFAAGSVVSQIRANKLDLPLRTAGTHNFHIKAVDTSGNYSVSEASSSVIISAPTVAALTFMIEGPNVVLCWEESLGSFAVAEYIIRNGEDFGTSTMVAATRATTYTQKVAWGGLRRFWITAKDVAGNEGAALNVDVNILSPDRVSSASTEVIDNFVLFRWAAPPSGTLPIDHYEIYKGDTFDGASLIGKTDATFSSYFEVVAGNYTYWILAVDTAGNVGAERAVAARVSAPPDFVLRANHSFNFDEAETLTNIVVEGSFIRVPEDGGFFDIFQWMRGGV